MNAESSGNSNTPDSSAGAQGLMQFMPGTAQQYGVNPYDPNSAITGAAHYLSDLINMFGGDVQKAVAAYNWGPGNVQSAVRNYGEDWLSYAPSETQTYVTKVLG